MFKDYTCMIADVLPTSSTNHEHCKFCSASTISSRKIGQDFPSSTMLAIGWEEGDDLSSLSRTLSKMTARVFMFFN